MWDGLSWLTILVNKLWNVVKYEVSTEAATKRTTFWNVTPCNPTEKHRRFGGTYYLILKMEIARQTETSVDLF
jgi:hypothetical protein